ncbi:hypothetical protein [Mesorhizobium sp. CA16]|uniref:hypothetical protein n=1 Tax=Mesorhizobium sp. CA16 TaxID=588496 RepID=UPI001CCAFACC|nr:hypothetical protein [Mesorhizobium sp. CA16]MBZ9910780.1 hypothetical protein [Mesorhizobium sp. CA16]
MSKKLKRAVGLKGMPFGKALERLFRVDPKEIESEIEKTKRKEGENERYVEERHESIRRGARRAPRKFRP